MVTETDRNKARSAVVSAYHALDCAEIPLSFLHALADAAVDAVATDAEPVKTAPSVAVKHLSGSRMQGMVRSIDQYRNGDPKVIIAGSEAQALYALQDARHDILVLWDIAFSALSAQVQDVADLPQDVIDLVITAREFWGDRNDMSAESDALDKALEKFASRVPYEEDIEDPASKQGDDE